MEENEEKLKTIKEGIRTALILIVIQICVTIILVTIIIMMIPHFKEQRNKIYTNGFPTMTEGEIYGFNSKFQSYVGTQIGSEVNYLLELIIENNNKAKNDDGTISGKIISVNGEVRIDEYGNVLTNDKVLSEDYYNITMNKDGYGCISNIIIEKI